MQQSRLISGGHGGPGRSFATGGGSGPIIYNGEVGPPPPSAAGLADGTLFFKWYNKLGRPVWYSHFVLCCDGNHVFVRDNNVDPLSLFHMRHEHATINVVACGIAGGGDMYTCYGNAGYVAASSDTLLWTPDTGFPAGAGLRNIIDAKWSPLQSNFYLLVDQGGGVYEVYSYDPTVPGVFTLQHTINNAEPDIVTCIEAFDHCDYPGIPAGPQHEVLGMYDDGLGTTGCLRAYTNLVPAWVDEFDTLQMPSDAPPKNMCKLELITPGPESPHYGFAAVYSGGRIRLRHTNVYSWSNGIVSGTAEDLYGVCHNNFDSMLCVVGDNGAICSGIIDGIVGQTLTARVSGTTKRLLGVCTNSAEFFATGDHLDMIHSYDGITWEVIPCKIFGDTPGYIVQGGQWVNLG